MNWGLGQGTEMKMNYEAKSVSLALSIFSAFFSLFLSPLYFGISTVQCIGGALWVA